jgi:hypothetical protein
VTKSEILQEALICVVERKSVGCGTVLRLGANFCINNVHIPVPVDGVV